MGSQKVLNGKNDHDFLSQERRDLLRDTYNKYNNGTEKPLKSTFSKSTSEFKHKDNPIFKIHRTRNY